MKEDLLQKKKLLEAELRSVEIRQRFYNQTLLFYDTEEINEVIVSIINEIEEEEYTLGKFHLQEPDRQETGYYQREPDPSGCSSWGDDYSSSYTMTVSGEHFKCSVIMQQNDYNVFKRFKFSNCYDLKSNLSIFLSDKKHCYLKSTISINDFQWFPYIKEFLCMLSEWRYENQTLEIPDNVLKSISKEFTDSKASSQLTKK